MFGYVQPFKPELKVKELEVYKGYYCGLCKAIKERYTNTARFMLNYDCAVLSLLLSSMSDETPNADMEKCIVSPFKNKTVIRSREAEYAAAVNIMLGYGKIGDAAQDDRKLWARMLGVYYKRVSRRAVSDCPSLAEEFSKRMNNLHYLEQSKSADIDAVSSEFGGILGAVFSYAPYGFIDDSAKKALWHMGYNLGRWIYIADAVNDIIKDEKTHSYNVFLQRKHDDAASLKSIVREEAAFNLNYSLSESCKAYELLEIKRDKPLLDNIMYMGLAKKTGDILKGEADGSV